MTPKPLPSWDRLHELFVLNEIEGVLYRRERPDVGPHINARCAGKMTGTLRDNGYKYTTIDGNAFLVHRIIWKMVNKMEPDYLDHRDGNRINNRPDNLRLATHSQNRCNRKADSRRLLPKGIWRHKNKFRAAIQLARRRYDLGLFNDIESATAAYRKAAEQLHGEFARPA